MAYDSAKDIKQHILDVEHFFGRMLENLIQRIKVHDASKLQEPEKSVFDEFTPKLKETTYGSEEYKQFLEQMGVALKHHYENNTHHPEHFENGVDGMSLMDVMEMFCDWWAATLRHADGDLLKSIEINAGRFEMSDQLKKIFINTVKEFKWQ